MLMMEFSVWMAVNRFLDVTIWTAMRRLRRIQISLISILHQINQGKQVNLRKIIYLMFNLSWYESYCVLFLL